MSKPQPEPAGDGSAPNRRRALVPGIPNEDQDELFDTVEEWFGAAWLLQPKENLVQQLWRRRDRLASTELLLLGDALRNLGRINAGWVKGLVKTAKGPDRNNSRGALFEILALNFFCGSAQAVVPGPKGQKAFDGTVTTKGGVPWQVSIKAYGASLHERTFLAEAKAAEEAFLRALAAHGLNGASCTCLARRYPEPQDWQRLTAAILAQVGAVQSAGMVQIDGWAFRLGSTPQEWQPLARSRRSYRWLVVGPYHPNEARNLTAKLNEAFVKFDALAPTSRANRIVMARLPENAPAAHARQWVEAYFRGTPSTTVDMAVLYQPAVARDPAADTSTLTHCMLAVTHPRFASAVQKGTGHQPFALQILVGAVLTTPTHIQLHGDDRTTNLHDAYIYQSGHGFTLYSGTEGSMSNPIDGVFRHAVMNIGGQEMEVSGIHPPQDLLILGD